MTKQYLTYSFPELVWFNLESKLLFKKLKRSMVTRLGIAGGLCIFEYAYLSGGFVCLLTVAMSLLVREEQIRKKRYNTVLLPDV